MDAYDRLIQWGVKRVKETKARDQETLRMKGLDGEELGVKLVFWFCVVTPPPLAVAWLFEKPISTTAVTVWGILMVWLFYIFTLKPLHRPKKVT